MIQVQNSDLKVFNYNSKCVCSKLDSTVEEVLAEEDLSQDIKRQDEVLKLVKESIVKGQEKTRAKINSR